MCGGGGSTNSTTTQKFEPPEWTQEGWKDAASRAHDLASEPYQQYGLPTVAPLNDLQMSGMDMAVDKGMNGTPYGNQARGLGLETMQGGFLGQGPQANVTPGQNPFAGSNTYLDDMIGRNAANMTQAFNQGTAAQTDAAFSRAGGFGGSAYNQLTSQNATGLAKSIGDMATQNRFQDYTTQQGLAENAVNRGMDAQKFNTGANMGAYDSERNRMNSAIGMAPGFSADDNTDIRNVIGAGDAYGAYQQRLLDAGKSQFDEQNNYPQQQLQTFMNYLSQASGTNGGQTSTTSGPGQSGIGALLGGLFGGYGVSQFLK